ncbi:MAG: biotin--[acetyl-CoA-carboxylase] ligase [Bryobacteraceae bacterium]|nr:biotin--[acetyl-CoA-carboxylase] ligase [Bryobacteraceae bacterium]
MPLDVDQINSRLPDRLIFWMEQTDSTMLDGARLAAGGCPSGTVVGAESQTAGQGRQGRSWHSEKDTGLYFSVVLWAPLPPEDLPVVTLAAGLAVAEAITQVTGLAVDLRWPNDVIIDGRKACGILIQQHHQALVAGFGLNVNHTAFPGEIAGLATSLRMAAGREFAREQLLVAILEALDRHLDILTSQGKDAVLRLFSRASSYVTGRRVVVEQGGPPLRGVTAGLDPNGFLILRQDDGARTLILAGGVRPE